MEAISFFLSSRNGICGTRDVVFPHTDEPGKFLSPYGTSILRIVETNYESYYILHVEMQNAAALHLYTRKPEGIAREKQNYRNLAESMGFKDYQIQILDRMDLCPI
ncbi:prostaglandin-H2 D-isomerase-like [Paroedura picta]|uniref:prostaglandin-H2 D-isomerase-like n=1 Tax=Paroedura picta TaxID=143630 RepID=UPI004056E64D